MSVLNEDVDALRTAYAKWRSRSWPISFARFRTYRDSSVEVEASLNHPHIVAIYTLNKLPD